MSPRQKFGQSIGDPPVAATGVNSTGAAVSPGWSSADGGRVLFNSRIPGVRGFGYPLVTSRSASGWSTRVAIDGPPDSTVLNSVDSLAVFQVPSADRARLAFAAGSVFSNEQPPGGAYNGYGAVHATNDDGGVRWISKPSWAGADLPTGTAGLTRTKFAVVGGSDDLSTVYFMTRQTLTPLDGASGRTWDQRWALYKTKNGVLSNAGTLPDGSVDAAGSMSAGLDADDSTVGTSAGPRNLRDTLGNGHVVSRDGDRALFIDNGDRTVPGRVAQLYLHRDGEPSLLVSKSPTDPNDPGSGSVAGIVPIGAFSSGGSGANVVGASLLATGDRDLEKIVFATRDALLPGVPDDGAHVNTYRYDVATNHLEYLADLDRPGSAASRGQAGNIFRVNDDATRILFRDPGTSELRLWREGQSTLTLATGVGLTNAASTGISGAKFAENGSTVIFQSREPINGNPLHPPQVSGTLRRTQVYRFDEHEGGTPVCVSCPPLDAAVRGPASFDLQSSLNNGFGRRTNEITSVSQARAVSADGRRVYFTTTSTLDPRDLNVEADVYEWSADRGSAALLSSGHPDSRGDALLDVSANGDNVFFVTETRLTASDIDEIADVYVARVGGGLPDPPPIAVDPTCEPVLRCQLPPGPLGGLPDPGSFALGPETRGSTDTGAAAETQRRFAVPRTRSGTSRITLGVRVPGAGTIRASGRGVRRATRRATRSATYTVHVRLSRATKRRVAQRGRVRVAIRVRFAPRSGKAQTTTVRVTVKRAPKTTRKGR